MSNLKLQIKEQGFAELIDNTPTTIISINLSSLPDYSPDEAYHFSGELHIVANNRNNAQRLVLRAPVSGYINSVTDGSSDGLLLDSYGYSMIRQNGADVLSQDLLEDVNLSVEFDTDNYFLKLQIIANDLYLSTTLNIMAEISLLI